MRLLTSIFILSSQISTLSCNAYRDGGLSDLDQTGGRNVVYTNLDTQAFHGLAFYEEEGRSCNVAMFTFEEKYYFATAAHCIKDIEKKSELALTLKSVNFAGKVGTMKRTFAVQFERGRYDESYDIVIYSLLTPTAVSTAIKSWFIPTQGLSVDPEEEGQVSFEGRAKISARLVEFDLKGHLIGQRFGSSSQAMLQINKDSFSHAFRADSGSSGAAIMSCKREGTDNFYAECNLICIHRGVGLNTDGICTAPHLFLKDEV